MTDHLKYAMMISSVGIHTQLRHLKIMKASAMTIINSIFKTFVLSLLVIAQVHFAYAQNAAILPPAKTTFVDQNGKPLTLGKVEFYIPGTSTRKTTWQDADATIPNTNPVNLDSAGRALILGNGAYRQVVRDRNNNVVWDQVTNSAGAGGSGTTTVGDGLSVGSVIPWAGFVAPANYAFTYGQELNRVTYNSLFNKITLTQNITCTSGSPTITAIADTSQLNIGAAVEAACIPAGATILSKTINSVTLTANALVSTTVSGVFFPWGNGNGLTTFNVPDYRGYVLPGRNNMGGSASSRLTATWYNGEPNSIGGTGGVENLSLGVANLPSHTHISPSLTDPGHTHTVTPTRNSNSANSGNTNSVFPGSVNDALMAMTANSNTTGITLSASTGTCTGSACTGAAFSIVQPSKTVNYVIKIAPDISLAIAQCANITDAGTACTYNVGTSGATVPLNSSANTFSAVQTFTNGVSISGGTSSITGLAAPTLASDAATKAYVDSVASGLNILAPSTLATAAVLPNSPTYSNGALGVGATLTAGSNTTLTVDGTAAPLATVVLVKNQASAFQNGVYTVTQAGSGAAPWILTRATYFDQAAEMKAGSYTLVTGGATNSGASYTLQTAVTTVGTDALNWLLFSQAGGNVVGPVSSVSANIASYNGTNGKLIQDSGIPTSALPTTAGQIPGIASNTAATAGNIGELITATIPYASRTPMTCVSAANSVMQSVVLTAGEWDCTGNHGFETTGGALVSEYHYEISTTGAGSLVTAPNAGCTQGNHLIYVANQGQVFPNGPCRISVAAPTTVYQKNYSTWGTNAGVGNNCAGSQTMYGYLRCTRVH